MVTALPTVPSVDQARRFAWRSAYVACLILVLLALVTPGACLPHSHNGPGVGLYNEDHDLSILAASSSAPLPVSIPLFVDVVVAPLSTVARQAATSFVVRDAESRAPPAV
jgi:hypothetical protein